MEEMRQQREQEKDEKSDLIMKLNAMKNKLDRLEAKLPRESPVVISCAYQDKWDKAGSVITYDSHVVEAPGEGGIDLDTGRFTVGKGGSGYYSVTYSGWAELDRGEEVMLWLYRNEEWVGNHGRWIASNKNSEVVEEQGSRTVILHLDEQDYLELGTSEDYFTGSLWDLSFCASLLPLPYN